VSLKSGFFRFFSKNVKFGLLKFFRV